MVIEVCSFNNMARLTPWRTESVVVSIFSTLMPDAKAEILSALISTAPKSRVESGDCAEIVNAMHEKNEKNVTRSFIAFLKIRENM
jgi:hypothetical protein